ncbi:MAG TPA: ATP-binding protein [Actinomycetota bacterium]|nr:ATP-binding protein [Actinomycetota bacterium]
MLDGLAVPLHFTIEFVGFLVTAGAALLVGVRAGMVPGGSWERRAAASGFAILAAAQVAHGGGFVDTDGGLAFIALRTVGFALVAAALARAGRGPAAAAFVPLREPAVLASAGAALAASVAAALAARRFRRRPFWLLSLAALLAAAGSALSGAAPYARFGAGPVDPAAYAAHGVRLLGYAALTAWLWSGIRTSIRTRFVASFAALLVAVVLALSSALTGVISNNVERQELDRMRAQLDNAIAALEDDAETLTDNAQVIAASTSVQQRVAARAGLGPLAREFAGGAAFDVDFVLFTSPEGRLLARAGRGPARPAADGDVRSGPLSRRLVLDVLVSDVADEVTAGTSPIAAGVETLGDGAVAVMAASEIADPDAVARRFGTVVVGRYVDALAIGELSRTVAPARASLVLGDATVATGLSGDVAARKLVPRDVRDELTTGDTATRAHTIAKRSYFSALAPVPGGDGDAVLVLSSPARLVAATRLDVTRLLFVVALAAGAIALGLASLFGRRITRPIQELTTTAGAVREGDLSAKVAVRGHDEVAQLGATFNEMTEALGALTGDLRSAAREEHRLRARIETIIESMADGLVAVDAERRVLAFNPSAERITGIAAADAAGKPVDDVLDVRDARGEPASLPVHDLESGSTDGVFVASRDGSFVPVSVTSEILRGDDGAVAGAVAVVRDVTREREVERMKSEFLSNISHELRTPLTPIKGYAELLARDDVPPDKARRFTTGILEGTERLDRIVGLLVDFAALEGGRLAPRSTPIDVARLLEDVARAARDRTTRHDIVTDVDAPLPPVMGDERLLRRSLEEVVDNAVKFSPAGGRIVLGASGHNGHGARAVEVTVADEGIGMDPDDLPHIFSDFHQLDGSQTRSYGGLGLGLSFVRRIVEAHAGRIRVESEPDAGTRLTISIPAAPERAS